MSAQDVTPMSATARAELAPNGRLRAALNYSNFLLVSSRAPEHTGVAPDLARELARRANATVEFIGYDNAGLAADAARERAWDVAFIGAEPARAGEITFTPAYVEIEATYVVPAGSPIRSIDDVDREGVRIATTARAAYTLYLQRTLRHATLVEADGLQGSFDLFTGSTARRARGAEAAPAGRREEDSRERVCSMVASRRCSSRWECRKERTAAAAYLAAFAQEIKSSGLLAALIERHGARGLTIAK